MSTNFLLIFIRLDTSLEGNSLLRADGKVGILAFDLFHDFFVLVEGVLFVLIWTIH